MGNWPENIAEAAAMREELVRKVRICPLTGEIRTVAGVDVAYSGKTAVAAAVLYDLENLVRLEEAHAVSEVTLPYVPGYLFFREGEVVMSAVNNLSRRPDLLMADGQGIAHPKKAGHATLLGVLLDLPSIGCAKSRLVGEYEEPSPVKGARTPLIYRDETIGAVLRTRERVRPVFVSPGHLVTLDEAVALVLRCTTRYRLPEPVRAADALAGQIARIMGK